MYTRTNYVFSIYMLSNFGVKKIKAFILTYSSEERKSPWHRGVILWRESFIRCEMTGQWRRLGVILWRESFTRHKVTAQHRRLWSLCDASRFRITWWLCINVTCDRIGTWFTYMSQSDYIATSLVTALGLDSHTCHKVTTLRRHMWPHWDLIHIRVTKWLHCDVTCDRPETRHSDLAVTSLRLLFHFAWRLCNSHLTTHFGHGAIRVNEENPPKGRFSLNDLNLKWRNHTCLHAYISPLHYLLIGLKFFIGCFKSETKKKKKNDTKGARERILTLML